MPKLRVYEDAPRAETSECTPRRKKRRDVNNGGNLMSTRPLASTVLDLTSRGSYLPNADCASRCMGLGVT